MTKWFGESWGAPVCEPGSHIAIPVGMPCAGHEHMHERAWDIRGNRPRSAVIEQWDQGVLLPYYAAGNEVDLLAYHLDCWLHEVGADRLPPH